MLHHTPPPQQWLEVPTCLSEVVHWSAIPSLERTHTSIQAHIEALTRQGQALRNQFILTLQVHHCMPRHTQRESRQIEPNTLNTNILRQAGYAPPQTAYGAYQYPGYDQPQTSTGYIPPLYPPYSNPEDPAVVRMVNDRPKAQCWEHGCNGRQFSTFSNLLRHQREKSGKAQKSTCDRCGAEFTRTTARNGINSRRILSKAFFNI